MMRLNNLMSYRYCFLGASVAISMACVFAADKYQPEFEDDLVKRLDSARALRRLGFIPKATKELEELVKSHPNYYLARYNLGLAYGDGNNVEESINELSKAKEIRERLNLKDATIYNSLGWAYILGGRYSDAERELKKGEENQMLLNKESRRKLTNNLGLLYMYKGDYKSSQQYLQKAANEYDSDLAKENLKQLKILQENRASKNQ